MVGLIAFTMVALGGSMVAFIYYWSGEHAKIEWLNDGLTIAKVTKKTLFLPWTKKSAYLVKQSETDFYWYYLDDATVQADSDVSGHLNRTRKATIWNRNRAVEEAESRRHLKLSKKMWRKDQKIEVPSAKVVSK